jgi:hypothetical protein
MPVVEISAGAWTNFANRITNFVGVSPVSGAVTGAGYHTTPLLGAGSHVSVIRIYSGTRQSAWMGNTISVDSNRLVQWIYEDYTSTTGPVTYTVTGTSPLTTTTQIITGLRAATASGTASWFLLGCVTGSAGAPGTTLFQQITGTVGVPGSGADLIMDTTTIVSGELYKVADLRLTFSSVFTYT